MNQRRRRYQLKNADLNEQVENLVREAAGIYGFAGDSESVRQIVVTALRLMRQDADDGDLRLINASLKELRHSFQVFDRFKNTRKVSVFGSARTKRDHPDWKFAREFASRLAAAGWMVITGAGDGIMGAAQAGAGRGNSFGVNIRLPFEQSANKVIAGDPKLINFRYFFSRKVVFVKESHAIALFPGGFGTHDEGFETLTLVQTGKAQLLPIVCVDPPGSTYWQEWGAFIEKHLLGRGLINSSDEHLYRITGDMDEAVDEVLNFYSNFHSSRFVGDQLVIRVRRGPSDEQLDSLNEDFADIVVAGRVRTGPALPEEADDRDVAHYPRVFFAFNRRDLGRLRQLVDRLNGFVTEHSSPAGEAVPQIVPEGVITPEDVAAEEEEE